MSGIFTAEPPLAQVQEVQRGADRPDKQRQADHEAQPRPRRARALVRPRPGRELDGKRDHELDPAPGEEDGTEPADGAEAVSPSRQDDTDAEPRDPYAEDERQRDLFRDLLDGVEDPDRAR